MAECEKDDMIRKDGKDDGKSVRYFTGHTKRYVKVKVTAYDSIVNRIVKVELQKKTACFVRNIAFI